MRTMDEIRAVLLENAKNQTAGTFDGLTSDEIASYNRISMFGENDEAFPSEEEWSAIVD